MTTTEQHAGDRYLIRKRGAFYRTNAEGYTNNRAEAGRYTLAQAIWHSHPNGPNGPRDGIDYVIADEPAAPCLAADHVPDAGKMVPEPVPATNQAVKWRERWYGSEPQKGSAIVDERGNLIAYFGGDETTHKATTAAVSAHNASIATQPATSQEGEIGTWQENVEFLLAKCPHTIRGHEGGGPENLIVSLVLTFGKMQHMLAATPTPPLLDLRECCDLSITSADIWEALFAIYKQDVPPAITEGVCNQLASCLEWSRPSGRVMAALAAQENAEDGRASCVNCEGEGRWEHCPSCSLAFGRAIDLRRATLATQPATSPMKMVVDRDWLAAKIAADPDAECEAGVMHPEAHQPATSQEGGKSFASWSTETLAQQCRMQARDQLDPELSSFLAEVADRLAATPTPPTLSEDLRTLIVVTDAKGFVTLHEPDEDGNAGDLVASVWRDDWLPALAQVKAS